MKNLFLSLTILVLSCNGFSQQNNDNKVKENQENKILVYFFHGTHRCAGCINAEKTTVAALNALYKVQLDKRIIKFESINVEEDKNKALAEKYEAAWNKLVFVKNDKSGQVVELTQQAFAYGSDNQAEMNKIVKTTVDNMLK
jgi:disulfide oxidoreductase YuzD